PTKLFNAWHAGVPAILGRESAYELQRRGELDYLEARTVPALVTALRRLRDEPEFRRAMVANGHERAKETDYAVITQRWKAFFEHMVIPDYERLRNAGAWQQRWHQWNGVLKTKTQDLQERLRH